ncbi:MAG: T9SS type A sorting domain-containing protein [Bacteroidota bacterium]|nr:T9SS type A sorting domain-containing protein [Bacteroidota bacterium]
MKKSILTFVVTAFSKTLAAQCCPYVFTPTVLPSTTISFGTNVNIVTKVSTPNQGTLIYSGYTINAQNINVNSCYWDGFATSPLFITDTISVGVLAPGNYSVMFNAYSSPISSNCIKNDSNSVATTFTVVGEVTSISNSNLFGTIKIYPNPAKDKLVIENVNENTSAKITDSQGMVVLRQLRIKDMAINISQLSKGIYILELSNGVEARHLKFIKEE